MGEVKLHSRRVSRLRRKLFTNSWKQTVVSFQKHGFRRQYLLLQRDLDCMPESWRFRNRHKERGAQIPGTRSPWRLNFVLWRIILAVYSMEPPSCNPSSAQYFELFPRFLENFCIPCIRITWCVESPTQVACPFPINRDSWQDSKPLP